MTKPKTPKTKALRVQADPASLAKRDVDGLLKTVRALQIRNENDQHMMEDLLLVKVKPKEGEVTVLFNGPPYLYREKKESFDQVSKARRAILSVLEKIEDEARKKLNVWYQDLRVAAQALADKERERTQKAEAKRIKKTTGEIVDPRSLIVPEVEVEGPAPAEGITIMKNWTFQIPDFEAFVAGVAAGRIPLNWLLPNERLMRETSKATEAPSGFPEVLFFDAGTMQVRKG